MINYDLPKEVQDYVHRIGRTGRVGNRGKATSFYDPKDDVKIAGELVPILKESNQPIPEFFSNIQARSGGDEAFGGANIRKGVDDGKAQGTDDDW